MDDEDDDQDDDEARDYSDEAVLSVLYAEMGSRVIQEEVIRDEGDVLGA